VLFEEGTKALVEHRLIEAISSYQKGLDATNRYGDPQWTATFLGRLGYLHNLVSQPAKAVPELRAAAALYGSIDESGYQAEMLRQLGVCYTNLSEYDSALSTLEQAKSIQMTASNSAQKSVSIYNILLALHDLYRILGRVADEQQVEAQIALYRPVASDCGVCKEVRELILLAETKSNEGNIKEVIRLRKEILQKLQLVPDLPRIADNSADLARNLAGVGDFRATIYYADLSAQMYLRSFNRLGYADMLRLSAAAHLGLGDSTAALRKAQLSRTTQLEQESPLNVAMCDQLIASICMKMKQEDEAEFYYRDLIYWLERSDEHVPEAGDMASLVASAPLSRSYFQYAGLLLKQHRNTEFIETVERGRSRILRQQIRNTIAPDAMTEEDNGRSKTADAVLSRWREDHANAPMPFGAEMEEPVKQALQTQTDLNNRYDLHPAAGINPLPGDLLDFVVSAAPDTLFLEWVILDEEQSAVIAYWPENKGDTKVIIHRTIIVLKGVGGNDLEQVATGWRDAISNGRPSEISWAYNMYLNTFAPLSDEIRKSSCKRIVFIPDGPLVGMPIGAIWDGKHRLLEKYTFRTATSISAMFWPSTWAEPDRTLLCVADPTGPGPEDIASGSRSGLSALPHGRREALSLVKEFPPSAKGLVGRDATKLAVVKEMTHYGILHFATHGVADFNSGLTSYLVLAGDAASDVHADRLEARDILNLPLQANLTVLSSCETGLGQFTNSDGPLSLAWAFRAAGCPSVVMSQWLVDDSATSMLMSRFYDELRRGRRKDDALRDAQISVMKTKRYAHPYFWAGFQLMGDPNPLPRSLLPSSIGP
jgi:CHAT domain-containing protein/tetratricopeptide (TPR) repeat protein